jgi:hypothetical protein
MTIPISPPNPDCACGQPYIAHYGTGAETPDGQYQGQMFFCPSAVSQSVGTVAAPMTGYTPISALETTPMNEY